jgi:hypothetical protein
MSSLHHLFSLDHRVFQGGRYLRAFDHLADIDHYEHSILTYLGSLMPFDRGFVDHPAFPSVARIASSTKICASTVRKKMQTLQSKGYVKIKEVRYLNAQGHFQQSSNNYLFTTLAFDVFNTVLESQQHISRVTKRAVGDFFSYPMPEPSPSSEQVGYYESKEGPLQATVPNSLPKSSDENLNPPYFSRDPFTMKTEVDRIAETWEKLLNFPVSKGEKGKFLREYVRINGNELYYSERSLLIAECPYLTSRAASLNFLFSGLDCAIKNREEIIKIGTLAVLECRNEIELSETLGQLPGYIQRKSQNYGKPTDTIILHLLQDAIKKAKERFGLKPAPKLPKNDRELKAAIQGLLATNLPDEKRINLLVILDAMKTLNFGYCLELFQRHSQREVAQ